MRHVLTAAIGSLGEQVDPQVQRFKLRGGDKLLLCTDGLTEMVDDATIARVMSEEKSAQSACQDLVDLSLSGGATDNVTVVLAHFRSAIEAGPNTVRIDSINLLSPPLPSRHETSDRGLKILETTLRGSQKEGRLRLSIEKEQGNEN
jgi:serine/threonine protein phosphatase PrpC